MKKIIHVALASCLLAATSARVFGQLNVSSDGSDGALVVTADTNIDLSLAGYGSWNNNNSTNMGHGVYDPSKWAVVFKYSSISIASNCTVTFSNHATHAPVVWLVQSNVTINGTVSVNGQPFVTSYPNYLIPTEPGPGGFRGGATGPSGVGAGYGPGGGALQGDSGGTFSYGAPYGSSYGNPMANPIFGGSGASGAAGNALPFGAGSSGAGAILIAAGSTATLNGQITALGGQFNFNLKTDEGGDGAIRIIANQIQGDGAVNAGGGRARMEANSISPQLAITPNTVAVPPGATPVIWPAANAPTVTVLSVNSVSAPTDPTAAVLTSSDVAISTNNPVDIILQSQNFPPSGSIVLRVTPKYSNYFTVNASFQSGNFAQATWKATTTLPNGFCVLQAHATSP